MRVNNIACRVTRMTPICSTIMTWPWVILKGSFRLVFPSLTSIFICPSIRPKDSPSPCQLSPSTPVSRLLIFRTILWSRWRTLYLLCWRNQKRYETAYIYEYIYIWIYIYEYIYEYIYIYIYGCVLGFHHQVFFGSRGLHKSKWLSGTFRNLILWMNFHRL